MNTRFDKLKHAFREIGIANLVPGFYDDPAFLQAEQQVPSLLDAYAEYSVLAAAMDSETEVEQKVRRVVSFLSPLVAAHGENGKCMPTTLLVQRFLDAEGIWNFPQKGGVVVAFPDGSKLPPKEWDPTDCSEGTFGHTWNVAPPFIIDLTISKQFYSAAEQPYVEGDVFVKEVSTAPNSPFDEPPSATMQKLFPPFSVHLAQCSVAYYPYGTGGPTESFTEVTEPVLDGLTPVALFERFRRKQTV